MPSTIDKIARAIDNRKSHREVADLSDWDAVLNFSSLSELAQELGSRATKLQGIVESINKKLADHKIHLEKNLASLRPDLRAQAVTSGLAQARRELIKITSADRDQTMRDVQALERQIEKVSYFHGSPAMYASRHAVLFPDQVLKYKSIIDSMGHSSVEHICRLVSANSKLENRKHIAAALSLTLANLPTQDRPVSVAAITTPVWNEEFQNASKTIQFARSAANTAKAINRKIDAPSHESSEPIESDGLAKIARGLAQMGYGDRVNDAGKTHEDAAREAEAAQ